MTSVGSASERLGRLSRISFMIAARDLAVTTDFRSVLGEIISSHLGDRDLAKVFPGFTDDPAHHFGLIKT